LLSSIGYCHDDRYTATTKAAAPRHHNTNYSPEIYSRFQPRQGAHQTELLVGYAVGESKGTPPAPSLVPTISPKNPKSDAVKSVGWRSCGVQGWRKHTCA
jgi:hypothetical protein